MLSRKATDLISAEHIQQVFISRFGVKNPEPNIRSGPHTHFDARVNGLPT